MTFKNKLEALYATRNHWQWLAITGHNYKTSYRLARDWPFECACCLYAYTDELDRDCRKCPLAGYAWGVPLKHDTPYCAFDSQSFYQLWMGFARAQKEQLVFYAHRIVYACNLAIEAELLMEEI